MSETTHYPNFYEPAEGRSPIDPEQLAEAAQIFNSLFDDLMLQGMPEVKQFETIKGRPTASLLWKIEVDGQAYTLALEDESPREPDSNILGIVFRDSERITRQISLQRIDGIYGREHWAYRYGADGVVRRWDGGDVTAKRRKDRALGIEEPKMPSSGKTIKEIGQVVLANMHRLTADTIPNSRLEEDMGLNNQPVTPNEMWGLHGFLARATVISR
ncbi:MAG: hypothetical protein WAQ57_04025 [Candidatus Saccharimonadales bacterium]